jgi:hypothetical protein
MTRAFLIIALSLGGLSTVAQAQEGGDSSVKTKFYDFDDLLVDGAYKKPQVLFTDGRQKVKFDRLMKLQRDFLPQLARHVEGRQSSLRACE